MVNSSLVSEIAASPLGPRLRAGEAAVELLSCHPCLVFCDTRRFVSVFLKADEVVGRGEFVGHAYTSNRASWAHTGPPEAWGYVETCRDDAFVVFASVSVYLTVES